MRKRLLDWITRLALDHPGRIFIGAAITVAISVVGILQLRLDPDLLSIFPRNDPVIRNFRTILDRMGTLDYHVVAVEFPKGESFETYTPLLDSIGTRFQNSKAHYEQVTWQIPNPLDYVEQIIPSALLLLGPDGLPRVADTFSDEKIRENVARNRSLLQTPQSFAMKDLIRYDPFGLLPLFLDRTRGTGQGARVDLASGYYISSDHSMALIVIKPTRPAQDLPFTRAIIPESEQIIEAAKREFAAANAGVPLPKVFLTGGYAIAFDDSQLIKKDIIINIITSIAGVLLLFVLAFRRPVTLLYSAGPMILAIGITFAIGGFFLGDMTSASGGFAAMLAGLGIDFITVLYGRFVEERQGGADVEPAFRKMMSSTMPGVITAALTTAATFLAFLVTHFRGMSELGLLTGIGILVFLLCVMFVFTALLVVNERRVRDRNPRYYHYSFGAPSLVRLGITRPRLVIGIWIVLTAVSAVFATRTGFKSNIQNLRARGNRGIEGQERVTERFGQSFEFMMIAVEGKTAEEAIEGTARITRKLDEAVSKKAIESYQAITSFVPPVADQRRVMSELAAGSAGRFSFARIDRTFRQALADNGFRPASYDDYLPLIGRMLAPVKPVSVNDLPEGIAEFALRFMRQTPDGRWMSIIYLYPVGGTWPRNVPPILHEAAGLVPGTILTGINLISEHLRGLVGRDAVGATLLAIVIVFTTLAVMFRSLLTATFIFMPLIAGCVGMLGIMGALGLEFNYINVFVGLMLVGVATDYAVYIVERYRETRDEFPERAADTGKAVMMAAVTTIVGYGSYALSHYPGLRSIGYAATFGVGMSALASLTLVPAVIVLRHRRKPD